MKDTLTEFCEKIVLELDNEVITEVNPIDKYKESYWWNSINALIIIAFINTEYGRKFTSGDLMKLETFEDLYNLLNS